MEARLPKNVPGDFYTTGFCDTGGQWSGECMQCGMPEEEAPHLLAERTETNDDTYFVKQPETEEELSQAILATRVCCAAAVRYGGTDKSIINRVDARSSDYKISIVGRVVPSQSPWWMLW